MTVSEAKEARIREIVRKIAEAEQLGGGFRLYFETAVRDLLKLCEPEPPKRKGLFEQETAARDMTKERSTSFFSRDYRDEAVTNVDGRHGYTIEFASDRAAHAAEYDDEELRLQLKAKPRGLFEVINHPNIEPGNVKLRYGWADQALGGWYVVIDNGSHVDAPSEWGYGVSWYHPDQICNGTFDQMLTPMDDAAREIVKFVKEHP